MDVRKEQIKALADEYAEALAKVASENIVLAHHVALEGVKVKTSLLASAYLFLLTINK